MALIRYINSNVYRAQLEATARQAGKVLRSEGDATRALEGADKRVVAEYYIPTSHTRRWNRRLRPPELLR